MIKSVSKNLVICPVGDASLHRNWVTGNETYDTYLIYYGNGPGYYGKTKHYRNEKGPKYHLIKKVLDEEPDLLEYDYIFLPDDDLFCTDKDIEKLFHMMGQYRLDIAQPSIMGWYGVAITLHQKGSLLRYTNWVEIMCPCFSSTALSKCKEVFCENNCAWSIETIWNVLLGHPTDKIAIIDDIVVIHTRAVFSGDSYKDNADPLAQSMKEAVEVYDRWNLGPEMEKDMEVGTPTGGEVYGTVVYKQILKDMEDNVPKSERFWPPSSPVQDYVKSLRSSV